MPVSSEWSLPFSFSNLNFVYISLLTHAHYVPWPPHSSWFNHPNNIWWRVQIKELLFMYFSLASHCFLSFMCKYSGMHLFSNTLNLCHPLVWETKV
jgi:hypothetical protein